MTNKPERSVEEIVEEQKTTVVTDYGETIEVIFPDDAIQTLQAERQKREKMVEESRVSLLFLAEKVLKEINNTYAIDIKHADKKQWLEPGEFERIFLHRFNDAGIEALTQPNNP